MERKPQPSLAPVALALCAFLALTLTLYIDRMRWTHEEPRRALVAQEMLLTKHYLYSTVYQAPYFKKPPLHNWVIALDNGSALGADNGSVRTHALRVENGRILLDAAALSSSAH